MSVHHAPEPLIEQPLIEQPLIQKSLIEQPLIQKAQIEQPLIQKAQIEEQELFNNKMGDNFPTANDFIKSVAALYLSRFPDSKRKHIDKICLKTFTRFKQLNSVSSSQKREILRYMRSITSDERFFTFIKDILSRSDRTRRSAILSKVRNMVIRPRKPTMSTEDRRQFLEEHPTNFNEFMQFVLKLYDDDNDFPQALIDLTQHKYGNVPITEKRMREILRFMRDHTRDKSIYTFLSNLLATSKRTKKSVIVSTIRNMFTRRQF